MFTDGGCRHPVDIVPGLLFHEIGHHGLCAVDHSVCNGHRYSLSDIFLQSGLHRMELAHRSLQSLAVAAVEVEAEVVPALCRGYRHLGIGDVAVAAYID